MRLSGLLTIALAILAAVPASAEVFHSRESALRLAFPSADQIEVRDVILTGERADRAEALAGQPLESRMVSVYEGFENGESRGFAFFDTHNVRSLPETVLLVLEPNGHVRGTHLLAFHEPKVYLPTEPWLDQFDGRELSSDLALGHDIAGMGGSTLTAQAITSCVRRLLAVWEVEYGTTALASATDEKPAEEAPGIGTR